MISEGRSKQTLKDITEAIVDCEHKTAPTQEFGIPLIRTTDIQNGRLSLNQANRVSEEIYKIWCARMEPKPGDIILAREAPVGEVGMVPKDESVCLGQRTVLIRIDKEKADPRYVLYLLCDSEMKHEMISRAAGSVVPHLNMFDIRTMPIPELPPISEQEQIGRILGALDDKMSINSKMNEILEQIGKAIFKHWFIDFEFPNEEGKPYKSSGGEMVYNEEIGKDLPKEWEVKTINDVVTVKGGSTPSTTNPRYWDNGKINWCTPKDLSDLDSTVLLDTERKITEDGLSSISSGLLPIGTVLLSSRAPIGYLAISEITVAVNQGFIAIVCDKVISKYFMLFWLNHNLDVIKSRAHGTTFEEINKASFREIPVILPSGEILKNFNELIDPLYKKIVKNEKERNVLSQIRDSLIPKLMSGKIRVPKKMN